MSAQSGRVAGIVLIVLPTVVLGGVSVLSLLIGDPGYRDNPLGRTCGAPATRTPACCCSCP